MAISVVEFQAWGIQNNWFKIIREVNPPCLIPIRVKDLSFIQFYEKNTIISFDPLNKKFHNKTDFSTL